MEKLYNFQAFALLSDKLTPLVDGVRNNKANWLQMAQNVQNYQHRKPSLQHQQQQLHNNNNVTNDDDDDNNGTSADTPKIVGKFGKFDSQYNLFYHKQNGSILMPSNNCSINDSNIMTVIGGGDDVSDDVGVSLGCAESGSITGCSENSDEAMD